MDSPTDAIRHAANAVIGAVAELSHQALSLSGTVTGAEHPFQSGVHEPMHDELTLTELDVTGTIPATLNGLYLRNGPNPVDPPTSGGHWFLGEGMIHGLELRDGRAISYRNRFVRSTKVSKHLGEAPAPGPRHGSDNVNTNVQSIGGRIYALSEAAAFPVELNRELGHQEHNPFDGTLKGSFTAHPHRDWLTGEHHAVAYEPTSPDKLRHVVVSDDGKVLRDLAIHVEDGPMAHDCAVTKRFFVVLDLSVTFSVGSLLSGYKLPYRWNPKHQARVGLLPRDGGADSIIWCDLDPVFVFHVANAYDDPDGRVILDVVAYDRMFDTNAEGPDAGGRFERWTVDPVTRAVDRQVIDGSPQEFPRPDDRLWGQPYRYAYAIEVPVSTDNFSGGTKLYKHDLHTGGREIHDFGPGRYPGEFVFIPASADAAEDEGWLIGLVVDSNRQTTDLAVLDARAVTGEPVATIHIPHRIPPGFHGNWVPA